MKSIQCNYTKQSLSYNFLINKPTATYAEIQTTFKISPHTIKIKQAIGENKSLSPSIVGRKQKVTQNHINEIKESTLNNSILSCKKLSTNLNSHHL